MARSLSANTGLNVFNLRERCAFLCILLLVFSPVDWCINNDIAIHIRRREFHSRAGQTGHSIADGSPPLQYFFGVETVLSGAQCRGDGPRQSLHASA